MRKLAEIPLLWGKRAQMNEYVDTIYESINNYRNIV